MIYLKINPDKTIQYASASPESGLVPYDGVMPDFPLLDDGSTAGWVGYRLVDGQITFDQAVWDNWVQTNKSPEPVALLAGNGAINADIRRIAITDTAALTLLNGWAAHGGIAPKYARVGNTVIINAAITNPSEVAAWTNPPFVLPFARSGYEYITAGTSVSGNKDTYKFQIGGGSAGTLVGVANAIPANTPIAIDFFYIV